MRRFPKNIKEFKVFGRLNSPSKVQDFLDAMPINFEEGGDTCRSPLATLRVHKAHCLEGALLAASVLWYHGQTPLLLDLVTAPGDDYHVVALFKKRGKWGAVSKTNHAVLRYRDPVYKSVRELAMSYFNEYFLDDGRKTLRQYSEPFNLLRLGTEWLVSEKPLHEVNKALDRAKHFDIVSAVEARHLRLADKAEREAGKIVEWKRK